MFSCFFIDGDGRIESFGGNARSYRFIRATSCFLWVSVVHSRGIEPREMKSGKWGIIPRILLDLETLVDKEFWAGERLIRQPTRHLGCYLLVQESPSSAAPQRPHQHPSRPATHSSL